MNVFAKFDEIPSMILQDIKETKHYGHTVGRSDFRTDGRTDNVKTVYPPTNTACGGYKNMFLILWKVKSSAIRMSEVEKNRLGKCLMISER